MKYDLINPVKSLSPPTTQGGLISYTNTFMKRIDLLILKWRQGGVVFFNEKLTNKQRRKRWDRWAHFNLWLMWAQNKQQRSFPVFYNYCDHVDLQLCSVQTCTSSKPYTIALWMYVHRQMCHTWKSREQGINVNSCGFFSREFHLKFYSYKNIFTLNLHNKFMLFSPDKNVEKRFRWICSREMA